MDAFAEELERQGYGNKRTTLYDIRDELFGRYKDQRPPYREMSVDERFRLLTGETRETLHYGKLVTCVVTGFAYRKPNRDRLDSADPVKDDETGLWQCPFCTNNTFTDLSEVLFTGCFYNFLTVFSRSWIRTVELISITTEENWSTQRNAVNVRLSLIFS